MQSFRPLPAHTRGVMSGPQRWGIWPATEHTSTPPTVVLRNLVGGSIFDPPTFYFTAELVSDRKRDLPPWCIVQGGGDRVCVMG